MSADARARISAAQRARWAKGKPRESKAEQWADKRILGLSLAKIDPGLKERRLTQRASGLVHSVFDQGDASWSFMAAFNRLPGAL